MTNWRGVLFMMPFFFYFHFAKAQGGRSAGLADANAVLYDESTVFHNIGGAARVQKPFALVSFNNRYSSASLNTVSAGLLVPTKIGVVTSSFSRFGNDLYNENLIGLGYSHKIQTVSLGVKASYLQHHIQEYGTSGVFLFEFGGIAEVIPDLYFGAHIYNFSRTKLSKETGEQLPVIMRVGLGYEPIPKLLILAEVEKNEFAEAQIKAAIEYQIIKNIFLRTGIGAKPVSSSFGFGLWLKLFKIDYALGSYTQIGFQHTLSASYQIRK